MPERLALLNVYEVESEGETHHLICFLDPVLAGAKGIDSRSIIGQFEPGSDGGFDAETFEPNPEFFETFTDYMNDEPALSAEIARQALDSPGEWLYVVDPRYQHVLDHDPPADDLLGCFAVDGTGQVVPKSFQYNRNHLWFSAESGISGVLDDRKFYDWLHRTEE